MSPSAIGRAALWKTKLTYDQVLLVEAGEVCVHAHEPFLQTQKTTVISFFLVIFLVTRFFFPAKLTGLPLVCVSGVGPSLWVSSRCLHRVPHQVRSPAGTPGPWRTSYRWTPPVRPPLSCGSPPSPVCSVGRKKKKKKKQLSIKEWQALIARWEKKKKTQHTRECI